MLNNPLQPIITIKEVMELLYDKQNKNPFSLTFISLDKERKKGGDIIRLESCTVPRSELVKKNINSDSILPAKKPNHIANNTINVIASGSDKIIKIHIDLITEFNQKRVVW